MLSRIGRIRARCGGPAERHYAPGIELLTKGQETNGAKLWPIAAASLKYIRIQQNRLRQIQFPQSGQTRNDYFRVLEINLHPLFGGCYRLHQLIEAQIAIVGWW